MNRKLYAALLATSFAVTSPALALFNVQVLAGNRDAKFSGTNRKSDSLKGSELRAAAHLDPIPLVPIAFGLALSQTTFEDDSVNVGVTKIDGLDVDLEVEAWLPLELAGLVPYAKLGYTLAGAYDFSLTPIGGVAPKAIYKPSGVTLHVGIKYEFLLRLGVIAEFESGTRKLAYEKATGIGSAGNLFNLNDVEQNSTSLLIGVQAGI